MLDDAFGAAPSWPPRSDAEFASMVSAVSSAFGDPTRRDIYLFVRSQPGATAAEVAQRFVLHPNVARHHLDKLSAGGYVEAYVGERAGQAPVGRPSKRYRVPEAGGSVPGASANELMVMLVARFLEELPPERAECLAEEVGEEYGRHLANQLGPLEGSKSLRAALGTVADALTAHGFATVAETTGPRLGVVNAHCPFGDAAVEHPVLCALDRGIVAGMLSCLATAVAPPVQFSSRARGDEVCASRF